MSDQVTARLESAVEGLDIPVDGDVIATCLALSDRLGAKIACAVGAFDRAELWKDDGATSAGAWLRAEAGVPGVRRSLSPAPPAAPERLRRPREHHRRR